MSTGVSVSPPGPRSRQRGRELALLVFAAVVVTVAAVELGAAVPAAAAPRQLAWTGIAVALLVATLWRIPDHRRLARYVYTAGLAASVRNSA